METVIFIFYSTFLFYFILLYFNFSVSVRVFHIRTTYDFTYYLYTFCSQAFLAYFHLLLLLYVTFLCATAVS